MSWPGLDSTTLFVIFRLAFRTVAMVLYFSVLHVHGRVTDERQIYLFSVQVHDQNQSAHMTINVDIVD